MKRFIATPVDVLERSGEVSGAALRLYLYYLARRNRASGRCFPSLKRTAEDLGVTKSNACRARQQLVAQRWIALDGDDVRLLVGFEKSEALRAQTASNNERLETPSVIKNATLEAPEALSKSQRSVIKVATDRYQSRNAINKNNQINELDLSNKGEAHARPQLVETPKLTAADLIPTLEKLTGVSASASWKLSDQLVSVSLELFQLGFTPDEIERLARNSSKRLWKLNFVSQDLAAERNSQNGINASSRSTSGTLSPSRFRATRRIG